MVPGCALAPSVTPHNVLVMEIQLVPSITAATIGPEIIYDTRPLKNAQFRFSSMKAKILTTGIH